jgi:hypothetical protein
VAVDGGFSGAALGAEREQSERMRRKRSGGGGGGVLLPGHARVIKGGDGRWRWHRRCERGHRA